MKIGTVKFSGGVLRNWVISLFPSPRFRRGGRLHRISSFNLFYSATLHRWIFLETFNIIFFFFCFLIPVSSGFTSPVCLLPRVRRRKKKEQNDSWYRYKRFMNIFLDTRTGIPLYKSVSQVVIQYLRVSHPLALYYHLLHDRVYLNYEFCSTRPVVSNSRGTVRCSETRAQALGSSSVIKI